jgi:hypothetical protein
LADDVTQYLRSVSSLLQLGSPFAVSTRHSASSSSEGMNNKRARLLSLVLPPQTRGPLKLLCLGAHADDIEIGCGGTVLRPHCPGARARRAMDRLQCVGLRGAEARSSASALTTSPSKSLKMISSATSMERPGIGRITHDFVKWELKIS